jgi:uncharacterized lipoprotein YmbA
VKGGASFLGKLAILFAIAGCASSPPERFYALSGASPQARVSVAAYTAVVGPVTVPALVDRPQMVLRTGVDRVVLAEQSRWAEPLKDGITRVLADDLAQQLGDVRVAAYPESAARDLDFEVWVDVRRFDSLPGDSAVIDAYWTIRDADSRTLKRGRSLVSARVSGESHDALVAAHDRALMDVSRDIAAALREVADTAATRRE